MRLHHSKKDWQRFQNMKDLQARKKVEELGREQNRMDTKAVARAKLVQEQQCLANQQDDDEQTAAKESERQTLERTQQEQVAAEMVKLKQEEIKEIKMRQQLRESSIELRELEAKLRNAYVNKELHAQIQERKAAELYRLNESKRINDFFAELIEKEKEQERQREEEEAKRKLEYRKDLQEQMRSAACQQEEAFQQFLRDKMIFDDIARIIHEEDMREMELKMIAKKKTKEEMDLFKCARDAWKKKEAEFLEEEDKRLIEYWVHKDAEQEALNKEAKLVKEAFEKRQEVVMDYILEAKVRKEAKQNLLEELSIEQKRMKDEQRLREEMEKAVRHRIMLLETYTKQHEERLRDLERESQLDELYRQQLLMKFAEDERIDQMTRERRRQKIIEHKKAAQEQVEDRQRRRVEEMRMLKDQERFEEEQVKMRHKMIEEERLRMLNEHATHLIGFLPKGVLQPNDLPHLGSTVVSCKTSD